MEDWDVYQRRIEGVPAVIFTDLAAASLAPEPTRPFVVQVTFALREPGPDGLGTPDENQRLYDLEDELFAALCASPLRARYVGRITSGARREAFYYSAVDLEIAATALQAFARFAEYQPSITVHHDPQWTVFADRLVPTEFERQTIENRRLIDLLQQSGDGLEVPRPVEHFAWFATEDGRTKFEQQIKCEGFEVLPLPEDARPDPRWPFGIRLIREDQVTLEWIDPLTADLSFRAESCGGRYDGWGTRVAAPG